MNERIRELLVEAGVINNNFNPLAYEQWYLDSLEKFAELIVKECVRHFTEDYQRDFDTLWREDLSKSIKEHFGVEE